MDESTLNATICSLLLLILFKNLKCKWMDFKAFLLLLVQFECFLEILLFYFCTMSAFPEIPVNIIII